MPPEARNWIGVVSLFACIIGIPAGCMIVQGQQAATTASAVCSGEMDAGRTLICDGVMRKIGRPGL